MNKDLAELTAKLGGIIMIKAEIDNNFEQIYSRVFEKVQEMEEFEVFDFDFLDVLGDMGG